MALTETLFGTDGIRGRANCHPVTSELALMLGKAIALECDAQGRGTRRALIGKDTRLSGYMLETALTSGLVAMGMDVFLVGPLPTPAVALLTRSMNADVGIMLTASHNPSDDNGIKIFGPDGFKLSDAAEHRLEKRIAEGDLKSEHIRSDRIGKAYRIDDARGRYIQFAKSAIGNPSLAGLKIVIDCANGAAYQIAPWIFKELGADVVKIHAEPDGTNINNGCGALHPETVAKHVVACGADFGFSLDGDADRVVFSDATGRVVHGDRVLGMCALDYKARGCLTRDTLVVTVMSNLGLHEAMVGQGIRVEATAVGDRHVIERMRKDGCVLGGEQSGHLIFLDCATAGDGILGALHVASLMKRRGVPLGELADCMTEYPQQLASFPVRERRPIERWPELTDVLSKGEAALGAAGRILARYSGTEPVLRVLVEARDADAVAQWMGRISSVIGNEAGS